MGVDWEFAKRQTDETRRLRAEEQIEFWRSCRLETESNWRLILGQLDDFPYGPPPDFFFDRCKAELRRRGFSDADVDEMERIAHEIIEPYNEQLVYPELWPGERILEPAIRWQFENGVVDEERMNGMLAFARRCQLRT